MIVPAKAGFTLVEVLAALAIFAMAVVGFLGALNSELSAAREARVEEAALAQLQNRLALLQSEPLQTLQRKITLDSPPMTFTESIAPRTVNAAGQTALTGFWTLAVIAEWDDEGTKRQEAASVIAYAP